MEPRPGTRSVALGATLAIAAGLAAVAFMAIAAPGGDGTDLRQQASAAAADDDGQDLTGPGLPPGGNATGAPVPTPTLPPLPPLP